MHQEEFASPDRVSRERLHGADRVLFQQLVFPEKPQRALSESLEQTKWKATVRRHDGDEQAVFRASSMSVAERSVRHGRTDYAAVLSSRLHPPILTVKAQPPSI